MDISHENPMNAKGGKVGEGGRGLKWGHDRGLEMHKGGHKGGLRVREGGRGGGGN